MLLFAAGNARSDCGRRSIKRCTTAPHTRYCTWCTAAGFARTAVARRWTDDNRRRYKRAAATDAAGRRAHQPAGRTVQFSDRRAMMANCLQQSGGGETAAATAVQLHLHGQHQLQLLHQIGKSADVCAVPGSEYGNDERLPATSSSGGRRLNGSAERPLKFSIDNILRPEFGGGSAVADVPAVRGFNHLHHHQQHHIHNVLHHRHPLLADRGHQRGAVHHHRTTAAAATAAVSDRVASDRSSVKSRRPSSSASSTEPPSSPIDLSPRCTDHQPAAVAANNPLDVATADKDVATATAPSTTDAAAAAAAGSQQWPAWVYCTRYSDRPSSGKSYTLS